MQTVDLAVWLQNNVDWNKYVTLVKTIGSELNERKLRFDKSDLLERSLELFSDQNLKYVNKEGVDHIGPEGVTIEMKFTDTCLFTRKTKKKKNYVSDLQLMNSRGSSEGRTLPESYAEYLLICDTDSVAVISKTDLLPYVTSAGDGLKTTKLPSNLIQYVFVPGQYKPQDIAVQKSYLESKLDMQNTFLAQF
tara:strand:+ start:6303 stop:6878 length:576 start_codon:yes stop_codon:yes gene_type:complete